MSIYFTDVFLQLHKTVLKIMVESCAQQAV